MDVQIAILDTPKPLEADGALLGTSGLGELYDQRGPIMCVFGTRGVLDTMTITCVPAQG
jgi:hypothetical protein